MITTLIKPFGEVSVKEDTQFILDLEKALDKRNDLEIVLEKEGINVEILGIYSLKGSEKLDLEIKTNHKVSNTTCVTLVKGVLHDKAHSKFVGVIGIPKQAQQTDAALDHNVLTLDGSCINESQPILNIEASDVKASHGSTTGRINDSHLFYLQSRGLSKEDSTKLILEGFFRSITDKIIDEDIKLKVASELGIK